jgi:dolichol-phosphate mannosyltransferase
MSVAQANPRVRVLRRINRRGLASACIEGMMATAAPYIAVMDADLQHDERILPDMLAKLKGGSQDLVIATRNAPGGSMGQFERKRVLLSRMGDRLGRWVSRTDVSDPMSGYFILKRSYLEEVVRSTSGIGFKILLDLIMSARRPVLAGEVPYTFRNRIRGTSKLDIVIGLEYLQLLLDKTIGDLIPARAVIFGLVGGAGVLVAMIALWVAQRLLSLPFLAAQVVATVTAMTANFLLNNSTTYRDRRLQGKRLWVGLMTFYLACSVGAAINLSTASGLKGFGMNSFLAGALGLMVGAVWNYGATFFLTWRRSRTVR